MRRRDFLASAAAACGASAASSDPTEWTLREASDAIRSKKVSPLELTQGCLARIEKLQPKLNAFITVTADQALAEARRLQDKKPVSRLHGVPIGLKDLIDTAGVKTTAASSQFADRVPAADAEVVRLLRGAGAVILGKLNMDEFAYNFTSETSHFGPAQNPRKIGYSPGGSSGGSAVAVASRMCFGALGSDTGGSIRQPAAWCGIVGLKPPYELVRTEGVVPLAWSLDTLGPMCRTVEDAVLLLGAMTGRDYRADLHPRAKPWRIGIARELFFEKLEPDVEQAVSRALSHLEKLGARVIEVKLPRWSDGVVIVAEAAAYHASMMEKSPGKYHPWTRDNLEFGAKIPVARYINAVRDLSRLASELHKVFTEVDALMTPTSPQLAIKLDSSRKPDLIALRNTMPFNYARIPAISVPCGFSADGRPVGLQFAGPNLSMLAIAHAYEQSTEWHKRAVVI
jgi:aspartyl-tRNA(Asn)/glutamyl-tRNA(Gln) amidotransferase subunit A